MRSRISANPIPFKRISGGYQVGPAVFIASHGLDYLYMMSQNPHKQISCTALEVGYETAEEALPIHAVLQESGVYVHTEGSMSGRQDQSDQDALRDYRARVRDLEQRDSLEPAEQSELNWLKNDLSNSTYRGKSKGFVDEKERCRQRVCQNIRKAINALIENPETVEIGLHFQDCVTTGYDCRYVGTQEWKS